MDNSQKIKRKPLRRLIEEEIKGTEIKIEKITFKFSPPWDISTLLICAVAASWNGPMGQYLSMPVCPGPDIAMEWDLAWEATFQGKEVI